MPQSLTAALAPVVLVLVLLWVSQAATGTGTAVVIGTAVLLSVASANVVQSV